MIIGIPVEQTENEGRIAFIPESVQKLKTKFENIEIRVESGIGAKIRRNDSEYTDAGATVVDRASIFAESDLLLSVHRPSTSEIGTMKKGAMYLGFLDPFNDDEAVEAFKAQSVSAFSMELIPRTTKAQKMDALSSQASLAGYVSVLYAANQLDRILPMMMTPAGTLSPARVFIIGAGVAGLQAIATAKRLGARVEAYDTRPVVKEQVESLGAKFVEIEIGETGQTKDGYAKALTDEQLEMQRKGMAKKCAQSDIIITTAKLFGRPAPTILTEDMVNGMKPGSIIIDLAAETGGNTAYTKAGEKVVQNGVEIYGYSPLESRVATHASQMYSSNLTGFIEEFFDAESAKLDPLGDDEILKGALVTHEGAIVNELVNSVKGNK